MVFDGRPDLGGMEFLEADWHCWKLDLEDSRHYLIHFGVFQPRLEAVFPWLGFGTLRESTWLLRHSRV